MVDDRFPRRGRRDDQAAATSERWGTRSRIALPVPAVEARDLECRHVDVEAACVDVDLVGIRTRNARTVDPAVAEMMLRDHGIEAVRGGRRRRRAARRTRADVRRNRSSRHRASALADRYEPTVTRWRTRPQWRPPRSAPAGSSACPSAPAPQNTIACAAIPSPRPIAPRPSPRVALTLAASTGTSISSATRARMRSRCGARRGASARIVRSALATR